MNTIQIVFPNENSKTFGRGVRVSELLSEPDMPESEHPIVAMLVNNELTSLSYKIEVNARLKPVTLEKAEGQRVYRRSLCFLLSMAVSRRLPGRHAVIGHSLGDGYYYRFHDEKPVEQSEIDGLKKTMHQIVEQDLPIVRRSVAYTDALEYFEQNNMHDTALLVRHRNDSRIPVYTCDDIMDISHGPLVASTGILQYFDIVPYGPGFILRYPNEQDPYRLGEFRPSELLFSIYQEYKQWGKVLSVASAGQLNSLSSDMNEIRHFMQVAEALHDKKIAEIADRIHAQRDRVQIILIAGPSSSGKTTFTKKLAVQLTVLGLKPVTIGLDDYFVSREETPLDEHGNYDFEHIEAIDIELLNKNLLSLFSGDEIELPSFDFKTGRRSYKGDTLQVPQRGIVLMEGIHGLNDRLTERIPADQKFKVYVSALTQLNLDDHNRVSTTDNRLIRRLVRDYKFRGHSALDTLHMWPQVRRGENRNIFPFQDSADAAFNSALDYELGVLRNQAWPLLNEIKPYHDVYHEALRLLSFLENFTTIPEKLVTDFSILREFIGDSGFRY
jgi:uridine kinase